MKLLFSLLLVSTFAARAEAASVKRFSLPLTGVAHLTPTPDPCIFLNAETGSGTTTQWGDFTWADNEVVNFCSVQGGISVVSLFTLSASSGAKIFGSFETKGTFTPEGTLEISGLYRFISGTGAFSGVQGGGTIGVTAQTPDAQGVAAFEGAGLQGILVLP
jgi:hypothetical protein